MNFYKYTLPYKSPFKIHSNLFHERRGIIIKADYAAFNSYGEAAPLPGFSKESFEDVERQIKKYGHIIRNFFLRDNSYEEWISFNRRMSLAPSLRFALDTFFFDRRSKLHKKSIRNTLFQQSSADIRINIVIGIQDTNAALSEIKNAWDEGYETFKLKVGENDEQTTDLLQAIRSELPKAIIRIDANGAWDLDKAKQQLTCWAEFNLEYCEQPLPPDQVDQLAELRKESPVRIAADESIRDLESAREVLDKEAADLIILKPMLIGHYKDILAIKREAEKHDIKTIFTTSMESGIGRLATAHLAAGFLNGQQLAQGLSTGHLLAQDLLNDSEFIKGGHYHLPHQSGLGSEPVLNSNNISLEEIKL